MDAEKMFDRVAWDYMGDILGALGIGAKMHALILSLYVNPRARVRVNDQLSTVSIHNGTRQGCPLSPLLYILALEPSSVVLGNTWISRG